MQKLLYRTREVCAIVSLSRSQLHRMVTAGTFPAPVPLGDGRAVAFVAAEVEAWLQERMACRRARPSAADTARSRGDVAASGGDGAASRGDDAATSGDSGVSGVDCAGLGAVSSGLARGLARARAARGGV